MQPSSPFPMTGNAVDAVTEAACIRQIIIVVGQMNPKDKTPHSPDGAGILTTRLARAMVAAASLEVEISGKFISDNPYEVAREGFRYCRTLLDKMEEVLATSEKIAISEALSGGEVPPTVQ